MVPTYLIMKDRTSLTIEDWTKIYNLDIADKEPPLK